MIQRFGLLFAAATLTLAAQTPTPAPKKTAPPKPATATPKPAAPARPPGLYANFAISEGPKPMGAIVIKLFEKESPITVKNFTDLAQGRKAWTVQETGAKGTKPFFNGLTFHRVIPGFMIQGGDPLGNGTGGTETIPDEFHPDLKFDIAGRLAMANRGPNTGSCQFFITEAPTPHLTGRHTIFGQVVSGQELVDRIARVPRGPNDQPNTPIIMSRVTIQRVGAATPAAKPKPTTAPTAKPTTTTPAAKTGAPAKKTTVKK